MIDAHRTYYLFSFKIINSKSSRVTAVSKFNVAHFACYKINVQLIVLLLIFIFYKTVCVFRHLDK